MLPGRIWDGHLYCPWQTYLSCQGIEPEHKSQSPVWHPQHRYPGMGPLRRYLQGTSNDNGRIKQSGQQHLYQPSRQERLAGICALANVVRDLHDLQPEWSTSNMVADGWSEFAFLERQFRETRYRRQDAVCRYSLEQSPDRGFFFAGNS